MPIECTDIFFTDAISESVASGGGFGVSNILQQQLSQNDIKESTVSGSSLKEGEPSK
jgi:Rod binding domain-containing protein